MELISRLDAQRAGRRRFFTGKPCKHGHLAERFVSNAGCVQCVNFKTMPSAAAPNALVPQSPLLYSRVTREQRTPGMDAYVWSRILASGAADRYGLEYLRVRPLLEDRSFDKPYQEAAAVMQYLDGNLLGRRLRMTPKANGIALEAYLAKGWRPDTLVADGLAEWGTVPDAELPGFDQYTERAP
jgi:hypothetical protein